MHTHNFVNKGELMNDEIKNFRLCVIDVSLSTKIDDQNSWFVYFGASTYMSYNKHWFENIQENNNGTNIYLGDDHLHEINNMVRYQ